MPVSKSDWNARQNFTTAEQADIDAFLDRWGYSYDTIADAIADYYAGLED